MGELAVETRLESGHPGSWVLDDTYPTLDTEARLQAIISWTCPHTRAAS